LPCVERIWHKLYKMDGLETTNVASTPTTTPAVAPQPTPVATPVAEVPQSAPSTTQNSGDDLKTIFKNLNWFEVGFGILASATLFYAIYYYKYQIYLNKKVLVDMQNKIDELTIKVSDLESIDNDQPQTQSKLDIFK